MTNSSGPLPNRYELVRGIHTIEIDETTNYYGNGNWYNELGRPDGNESGVVAENIAAFKLLAADTNVIISDTYLSIANGNVLPEYVDVCLEMLDERAARQAAELWASAHDKATDLVERNVRRYTTRVYFQNRDGYLAR